MTIKGITTTLTNSEIEEACSLAEQAYDESISGATRFDSILGTTAFYMYKNDVQYIIFRGTQEGKDWLMNMSAIPWKVNGRWVHGGFAAAQGSVWKKIRARLDPRKKTYCIGHSLGGACATITALKLQSFENIRLITFGRPNVFLKGKRRLKDIVNISVVAGSDIVATVPRFCYSADSNQDIIYFGKDGNDYLNPSKDFRDGDRRLGDSISDHMMDKSYTPRVDDCKVEDLICDKFTL